MRKQETNKKTACNHACNPHILIGIIILTLSFFYLFHTIDIVDPRDHPGQKKRAYSWQQLSPLWGAIAKGLCAHNCYFNCTQPRFCVMDRPLASAACWVASYGSVGGHLDKFLSSSQGVTPAAGSRQFPRHWGVTLPVGSWRSGCECT